MRKKSFLAMLLTSAMVASVAGCSGGNSSDTKPESQTTVETVVETETTTVEQTTEEEKLYSDEMRDISPMEFVGEMKIGWNLGNTLDSSGTGLSIDTKPMSFEMAWGAQYTSQFQMDFILEAGFNVIRIPVSWQEHIHDDAAHTIEASWMDRIQEIVDYAYKKGVYVILNAHHEDWYMPLYDNKEEGTEIMKAVWTQIGEKFADYGDHLIFEGMNEPRKKDTGVEWTGDQEGREMVNYFDQVFVDTIRALGGKNSKRFLMVTGYAASSANNNLSAIVLPNDPNLIVSVHAYIPYNFALNNGGGAVAEWNHDTRDIDNLMKTLNDIFISKNIPVIIGEFGAMSRDNEAERCEWADYYVTSAAKYGIPCCWWDNHSFKGDGEKFGLLRCNGMNFSWVYPDLLNSMIKAAGAK